jgi:hypothetical protein
LKGIFIVSTLNTSGFNSICVMFETWTYFVTHTYVGVCFLHLHQTLDSNWIKIIDLLLLVHFIE